MHTLLVSPVEPELTRRSFLFGSGAASMLALTGLGTPVALGFRSTSTVTGYTATAGRFRRVATGFARCSENEERLCFSAAGQFIGQYLQGADTYYSAPWDDAAAPHLATSPAFLSGDSGDRIRYAGEHAEADIFGTAGKGVVIRNEIANQFHSASNLSPPGIVVGDLLRTHAIVAISGASVAGRVDLRMAGAGNFAHTFTHDANGIIIGQIESWATRRAGFHDMGIINGKRWWYLWCDTLAANTTPAAPGIGFGNIAADVGKSYHVCELMAQKNPQTAPAAVPVCATAKIFAADTLRTDFANAGYVCEGLAMARSRITDGEIIAPAVNVGAPYEPLETRIEIVQGLESADRSGLLDNQNLTFFARPWRASGTVFTRFYGPTRILKDWLYAIDATEAVGEAVISSVFQNRPDRMAKLGRMETVSSLRVPKLDVSAVILLASGDNVTTYYEQASILSSTGSSFYMLAGSQGAAVRDSLVMGSTLWFTRARHEIQQDETHAQRVYVGTLGLQCGGGELSIAGSRFHNMSRTTFLGATASTAFTIDSRDTCFTGIWMDAMVLSQGTVTNWRGDRLFMGPYTARGGGFIQSERAIQISNDAGASWADLSPSFDPRTMPHGMLAEHVGTWNFDTGTFTAAPDAAKSMRVRYWYGLDGITPKPGFQFWADRMSLPTHHRWPTSGDVFRIKNGDTWIDVTYQSGQWTSATTYLRDAGGDPASTGPVSEDGVQINRINATIQQASFDQSVFFGVKGAFFLTGTAGLPANGSAMTNIAVKRHVGLVRQTGAYRSDHSRTASNNSIENCLFIQAQNPIAFSDGSGLSLSIGASGVNNTVTALGRVTLLTSGTGLSFTSGASLVNPGNVRVVPARVRSNYTAFSELSADNTGPLYFRPGDYDPATGTAIMPTYPAVFAYRLSDYAVAAEGWDINATIAACVGNHARWNAVIDEIKQVYHKTPETVVTIANSASVGSVIATGVSPAFHVREGGNGEGYFEIVGGALRVAKPLGGVDRVFPLRGSDDRLMIVDVRAA
jgi:hypothetical protein